MPTTYAIPNGRTVMDATLYTGNATNRSISNADNGTVGFQPDFVWIKSRSNALNHGLMDSVRGPTKLLISNATNAEQTLTDELTSFNSNGFSLGVSSNGYTNYNNYTYVAWQWQAGQGTTSTNTDGSVTSTVSVNATAGFSVVAYTGTGSSGTIGHGLGVTPSMVILKNRTSSQYWFVNHSAISATQNLYLNTTDSVQSDGVFTSRSSTTVGIGVGVSASSTNYVAYCWAEIDGFSKFGSYTGNGSSDGPFIYTNFQPRFLMYKRTDSTGSWFMVDATRNPYNTANYWLQANTNEVEQTDTAIDLLSNGFKIRTTGTGTNANGGSYIYMAFASNPFKFSTAR